MMHVDVVHPIELITKFMVFFLFLNALALWEAMPMLCVDLQKQMCKFITLNDLSIKNILVK